MGHEEETPLSIETSDFFVFLHHLKLLSLIQWPSVVLPSLLLDAVVLSPLSGEVVAHFPLPRDAKIYLQSSKDVIVYICCHGSSPLSGAVDHSIVYLCCQELWIISRCQEMPWLTSVARSCGSCHGLSPLSGLARIYLRCQEIP